MFEKLKKLLLDIIFPLACSGCGAEGTLLCTICEARIPLIFKYVSNPTEHLDFIMICANYDSPLMQVLIKQFKYNGIRAFTEHLGFLLYRGLLRLPPQRESVVLVPVPLHKRKLRIRGYNQSELLADRLATLSGHRIAKNLHRIRFTKSQARLNRSDRLENLKNCFQYSGTDVPEDAILIDDVATTFATLESAAAVLKKVGSRSVGALVIAKNEDVKAA